MLHLAFLLHAADKTDPWQMSQNSSTQVGLAAGIQLSHEIMSFKCAAAAGIGKLVTSSAGDW